MIRILIKIVNEAAGKVGVSHFSLKKARLPWSSILKRMSISQKESRKSREEANPWIANRPT